MSMDTEGIKSDLDLLLGMDPNKIENYEKTAFDQLVSPFEKSLVLFGAGNLGRQVLSVLRKDSIEPLAFSDNNPKVWGKSIDGIQVYSPNEAAARFGQNAAFVVTIWNTEHSFIETKLQLTRLKCNLVVSAITLRWKYHETLLPFFWLDLPNKTFKEADHIKAAYDLWNDDFSRKEFVAQLKFRLRGEFDLISKPVIQESYFPEDIFDLKIDENFVDCGAFDGITIRKFLEHRSDFNGRIIAYEPDPLNYEKLSEFVKSLDPKLGKKISILKNAVGKKEEIVNFDAAGTMGSAITEHGGLAVKCVTLKMSLSEQDFIPSYIKMDIEGSELDALKGLAGLPTQPPIFSICLYHRYDDLWRIPLYINTLSDQYRFFLRPHEIEGWQLVCYAVPLNRLKKAGSMK